MNRKCIVGMWVLTCIAVFGPGAWAGDLNPSAPPTAGTMKTLEEVEPRVAVGPATTPGDATCIYKITSPGSYYLKGNVTGEGSKSGIVVAASNVTLDLNGFTLSGVAGSLDGIRPGSGAGGSYQTHVVITNGIVRGWGGTGVATYAYTGGFMDPAISYARIEGVIAAENGMFGIRGAYGGIIRNCIARDNGNSGILTTNNGGVVENCTSVSNGSDGFACYEGTTITNCSSMSNTGKGIYCGNSGHTIIGCTVLGNEGGGIDAGSVTAVKDCTLRGNTTFGIRITFDCFITDCEIAGNQGDGINGVNIGGQGKSRIDGNNVCGNTGYAMSLLNNPGNFIYRNTIRGNSLNVGADNSAPVSSDPATAGPWHNIVF